MPVYAWTLPAAAPTAVLANAVRLFARSPCTPALFRALATQAPSLVLWLSDQKLVVIKREDVLQHRYQSVGTEPVVSVDEPALDSRQLRRSDSLALSCIANLVQPIGRLSIVIDKERLNITGGWERCAREHYAITAEYERTDSFRSRNRR